MARPFQHHNDSGDQNEKGNNKREEIRRKTNLPQKKDEKRTESSSECSEASTSDQPSKRNISTEDIQIVAKDVEEDWKKLLKKLPGVTLSNLSFHQAFINAMDRKDSTNMAEIALSTWKTVLPELSTIENLSKTLFSIGHPDIVTCLRP